MIKFCMKKNIKNIETIKVNLINLFIKCCRKSKKKIDNTKINNNDIINSQKEFER